MNDSEYMKLIHEIGQIQTGTERNNWQVCQLVKIVSADDHRAWAEDIATKTGLAPSTVYDMRRAQAFRELLGYEIGDGKTNALAERGYTFFNIGSRFYSSYGADLDVIVDAIETADNRADFERYLKERYAPEFEDAAILGKWGGWLSSIYAKSEQQGFSDEERETIRAAMDVIEARKVNA